MSEETTPKVPTWFWVVAGIALIWNLLGVFAYIGQMMMTPEMLEALPADQRELMENTPSWATSAFAFAVWGGTIGSLLLLLRKKPAMIFFVISLIGVLIQMYHSFFIADSIEVYGPGGMIMPIMVIIISVGLVWLTNMVTKKGWLS